MCTSPVEIHKKDLATGKVYKRIVPCGKCAECLNRKQNDNAVLSYIEACKRGRLVFVTLTYNNSSFPLRQRCGILRGKTQDGLDNIEWFTPNFLFGERAVEWRSRYVELAGEDFSTVIRSDVLTDSSGNKLLYEYSPSLCRKDFRDYLKRERIDYERRHGEKLPDFSYMLVGEYGEQNHRPHYHCCFYGIEENLVREIMNNWTLQYGYIDVKLVQQFNSDPTHDGFFAASRYLGKYLTKGEADSYNVLCGLAEKSRVCRSVNFGIPDKRKLTSLVSFSMWKIMMDIHLSNELRSTLIESISM